MKKLLASVLFICVVSTSVFEVGAAEFTGEIVNEKETFDDVLDVTGVEVDFDDIAPEDFYDDRELYYGKTYSSSKWDKYSSYYFYNQMDSTARKFWNDMYNECVNIGNGTEDMSSGFTGYVYINDNMSSDRLRYIVNAFRVSNPQFYFLNTAYSYSYGTNYGVAVAIGIYDNFISGSARKAATSNFFSQLNSWEKTLNAQNTEFDKAVKAHEIVVDKVDYFDELLDDGILTSDEDEQFYTQSAYSVVCGDKTVCAGYSQAYTLLCNAVGVDAFSVTGSSHQWNKIRVNDSWYNVDCTWDDNGNMSSISYYFYCFMKNDDYMENYLSSHYMESFWQGNVPKCTMDTGSTYLDIGELPQSNGITSAPVFTVQRSNGQYLISITTATLNANIYYTTDGTEPSEAFSKSNKYSGTFNVSDYKAVKAVAVMDTYRDSKIAGTEGCVPTPYLITYILDGGTNNASNPSEYSDTSGNIVLKDGSRSGYVFMGWYLDSAFTKKIDTITAGNKGDITIYAKWQKLLNKPVVSNVSPANNGVKVSWKAVSGASKYRVFRKGYGENWKKIADTTSVDCIDKSAVSGTTYRYTVRCISDDGKQYLSSYDKNGKKIYYCSQPVLSSAKQTSTGVKVSWEKVKGASKYRVFRKVSRGRWQKVTDTTLTDYTDTGVASGTTYVYTVRCLSSDEKKYESSYDTDGIKVTYCSQPVLKGISKSSAGVKVNWNTVKGTGKYRVFRKTTGGRWTKVADTTSTSYTDKNVVKGTKYVYTVRCLSKNGKEYLSSYDTTGKSIRY